MSTVPRMRLFLREFAVVSAATAIVCFCSCERHHPSELPVEGEHAKAMTTDGAPRERAVDERVPMPATAFTPTPAPSPSAAQFFPENSPH
ncbi:MAG: hypothetical protein M3Z22_01860 [Verrucomicrobiota bacterium]|nr:hypothetical protein [Verrucomicrobiota bacterium]